MTQTPEVWVRHPRYHLFETNSSSTSLAQPSRLPRTAGKDGGRKDAVLLKRFSANPDLEIEKARAEFERAGEIEKTFHKDFDGVDFTIYSRTTTFASLSVRSPRKTG